MEIKKLKFEELKLQSSRSSGRASANKSKFKIYADTLRAVLAPMLELEELAPAWFRSAESMIKTCEIPDEAAGSIIFPFLNEKSRMLIANKSVGQQLLYAEVRDAILEELKLTPEEYRQRFYRCKKGNETWGQFVTKIEVLLDYYLRSRNNRSLDELRSLLIANPKLSHVTS